MSLKAGIVGLPNIGKSTLFNTLTKKSVPAENYPFCTIDPSVGIVAVPDPRLTHLATLSESGEAIPAVVEFVDIAGLVQGAAKGEGLGNKFLSHIREVDAIVHVVRVFADDSVTHVAGTVDPLFDIGVIENELTEADKETVTKRLESLSKDMKSGDKKIVAEHKVVEQIHEALEAGKPARSTDGEIPKDLHLLSAKPMLYVFNGIEEMVSEEAKVFLAEHDAFWCALDVRDADTLSPLIAKVYQLLRLISFFTTGKKETRAWSIPEGSTAKEAGAAIHTDFRDKFIRAQVVSYGDFVEAGSLVAARGKGKVRMEGKEYIVKDGDIIEFKI